MLLLLYLLLGPSQYCVCRCGLLLPTNKHRLSMCQSLGLTVMVVNPAKMVESRCRVVWGLGWAQWTMY